MTTALFPSTKCRAAVRRTTASSPAVTLQAAEHKKTVSMAEHRMAHAARSALAAECRTTLWMAPGVCTNTDAPLQVTALEARRD